MQHLQKLVDPASVLQSFKMGIYLHVRILCLGFHRIVSFRKKHFYGSICSNNCFSMGNILGHKRITASVSSGLWQRPKCMSRSPLNTKTQETQGTKVNPNRQWQWAINCYNFLRFCMLMYTYKDLESLKICKSAVQGGRAQNRLLWAGPPIK